MSPTPKQDNDGKEKILYCDGGNECRCTCHQKDYPLPKDFPQPSPRPEWEEDYENEKSSFLSYDKQSGSRFLNDEKLKSFIRTLLEQAKREVLDKIISEDKSFTDHVLRNVWSGEMTIEEGRKALGTDRLYR